MDFGVIEMRHGEFNVFIFIIVENPFELYGITFSKEATIRFLEGFIGFSNCWSNLFNYMV